MIKQNVKEVLSELPAGVQLVAVIKGRQSEEVLEAIGDPDHEEHERMLEWVGGGFEPDEFDIEAVNRRFAALR